MSLPSRTAADRWHSGLVDSVPSTGTYVEAERQLAAAAERHHEAVASMHELGRPDAGQHVAIKSVGRAVQLVSSALRRAAAAGVPSERLVELTGWEPDLVREVVDDDARSPLTPAD